MLLCAALFTYAHLVHNQVPFQVTVSKAVMTVLPAICSHGHSASGGCAPAISALCCLLPAAVGMVRLVAALIQPFMPSLTRRIMQQMNLPLKAADLTEETVAGGRFCSMT